MYRKHHIFLRWLTSGALLLVLLNVACSSPISINGSAQSPLKRILTVSLPGQQIWKGGVSSFLFGTNDTQEWSDNNVETTSSIQQALKDAHFTLMRTFFFDKSLADNHPTSDSEIEQRLKTIEKSGMVCMGILYNIINIAFDEHIVRYAGSRCQIYEFGNEPDYQGISAESYLKQWNKAIPVLRRINPNAKFIGPVTSNNDNAFMNAFLKGVKASGVLPDAVSFHWYPCYNDSESDCLNKASTYGQAAQGIQAQVRSVLGKDLPVGITEWNYDPGNPPPAYGDKSAFITTFSTTALRAMVQVGVAFACQFDAASYSGYGRLDMFDVETGRAKPQYYAIKSLIQQYRHSKSG